MVIIEKEINRKRKCRICGEVFLPVKAWHSICSSCWGKQKSLITEFIQALNEEIKSFGSRDLNITLLDGKLIQKRKGRGVYSFSWGDEKKINPGLEDTPIKIKIDGQLYIGEVIGVPESGIIICVENYLSELINKAEIIIDRCFLYELLIEKLSNLEGENEILDKYRLANSIFIGKGRNLPLEISGIKHYFIDQKEFNESQREAIEASQQLPLILIWGPPGTGKTKTIAGVVKCFLENGKKILVTTHSNIAVDEATAKIAELLKETNGYQDGKILRWGNYQKPQLKTDYPLVLPEEILKKKAKPYLDKRIELLQKKKTLEIHKKLLLEKKQFNEKTKIRKDLQEELKNKRDTLKEFRQEEENCCKN